MRCRSPAATGPSAPRSGSMRRVGRGAGRARGGDAGPRAVAARHRERLPCRHGRALLARTTEPEPGDQPWRDGPDFAKRDPSEHEIVDLLVGGIAARVRPGQRRKPVLAACGFAATGSRVLLKLVAELPEDAETVCAFLHGRRTRGLGDTVLVVADGAPGSIKAPSGAAGSRRARTARPACPARPASAAPRTACAASPPRCPGTSGRRTWPASCSWPRLPAGRSRASLRAASSPSSTRNGPPPSPAFGAIPMPASPTGECRSPAAGRSGPPTSPSASSSRNAGSSRSSPTRSASDRR